MEKLLKFMNNYKDIYNYYAINDREILQFAIGTKTIKLKDFEIDSFIRLYNISIGKYDEE